jgi:L-lactate utilization protein LutC
MQTKHVTCVAYDTFRLVLPIQSENSIVLGVVADKNIILACSGNIIITSSHTTPRSLSLM